MSWDSIGGFTFIRLDGDISPAGTTLQDITRPGADGVAYRAMGSRGEQTKLRGLTDCISWSAADSLLSGCKSLQGTLTTIVIRGETYSNFLVLDVLPIDRHVVASPIGGTTGGSVLTTIDFTVIYGGQ